MQIVHAVRGRVRLRLKSDDARELLPKVAHYLGQQAGILKVQIKQTNSLVVTFEPDVMAIEQLTESLQSVGSIALARETVPQSTDLAQAIAYSSLLTGVPPLVGLAIARSWQVSGGKSILAYILAAGVTREVIRVTGESEAESDLFSHLSFPRVREEYELSSIFILAFPRQQTKAEQPLF